MHFAFLGGEHGRVDQSQARKKSRRAGGEGERLGGKPDRTRYTEASPESRESGEAAHGSEDRRAQARRGKINVVMAPGRQARRKCQAPTPESSAETAHRRRASASFCASRVGVAGLHLTKYPPLTLATSGERARYTMVCAPCSGVSAKVLAARMPNDSAPPE